MRDTLRKQLRITAHLHPEAREFPLFLKNTLDTATDYGGDIHQGEKRAYTFTGCCQVSRHPLWLKFIFKMP